MSSLVKIETAADLDRVIGLYAIFNAATAKMTGQRNAMPLKTSLERQSAARVVVAKHAPHILGKVDINSEKRLGTAKAQPIQVATFVDEIVANRRLKRATRDACRQQNKFMWAKAPKVA